MDLVEGMAPSETEKEVVHGVRAGQMWQHRPLQELQPTLLCVCVCVREREREREREIKKKILYDWNNLN
jgi:hypothetical protein